MKACIVVRSGQSYTTIHTKQEFMNSIFKNFGRKVYDYFAQYRNTGIPGFHNGDVCWFVGGWKYELYGKMYWMITDGEKYGIIGREGILIEGKNNKGAFFNFIFNWDLEDD